MGLQLSVQARTSRYLLKRLHLTLGCHQAHGACRAGCSSLPSTQVGSRACFLPWFRAGCRERMREREERSWKEERPSCLQPSITLMPACLGNGEHHLQTGAAGCQQQASHPIPALPLPAVGSPGYLGNRGFHSSLQWCCLRWGQGLMSAALPCPPYAPNPACAAPSSAVPQEQGWDGCQSPSAPARLVLQAGHSVPALSPPLWLPTQGGRGTEHTGGREGIE